MEGESVFYVSISVIAICAVGYMAYSHLYVARQNKYLKQKIRSLEDSVKWQGHRLSTMSSSNSMAIKIAEFLEEEHQDDKRKMEAELRLDPRYTNSDNPIRDAAEDYKAEFLREQANKIKENFRDN